MNRRQVLTGSAVFAAGAIAAVGGQALADAVTDNVALPIYSGPAASIHAGRRTPPRHAGVGVHWRVHTTKKLVALTFDDGPMPQWTPRVLDALDEHQVPATFFMTGKHATENWTLVAGRLGRHEVGNHTWDHEDLARLDYAGATRAIDRAHRALAGLSGTEPVLLRPPYGHLGGSTLLAAADLGYSVVLWNLQMLESEYLDRPAGLVDYIVDSVAPGTIVLAHDTGHADRLVALNGLPAMISRLCSDGFTFVTVSQLLAEDECLRSAPRS